MPGKWSLRQRANFAAAIRRRREAAEQRKPAGVVPRTPRNVGWPKHSLDTAESLNRAIQRLVEKALSNNPELRAITKAMGVIGLKINCQVTASLAPSGKRTGA